MHAATPERSTATAVDSFSAAPGRGRRILLDGLAARFGGGAYATVQLARHLASRPEVAAVTVLTRRDSIIEHGLRNEPTVSCRTLVGASHLELIRRMAWQTWCLRPLVVREGHDVLISMSGMLPRAPGCAVVSLLYNPVMFERRSAANAVRRVAVRRTARRAVYVAAPSGAMADLVSAAIGRECAVAALGVDHSIFRPADAPGEEILCVADFYPHKRHELLLDAWLHLGEARPRLRLIGNPAVAPRAYAALVSRIKALSAASAIVLEHRISLDRLVAAYQRARVFVMASEQESFSMPLLESMACGVPPVVRALPSLRDTGGDGARYVDGDDAASWAEALRALIDDDDEYERARIAALQRASHFSWEKLAGALIHSF
jgi:glycosyltransferase involved in cell wall biosynthesis